MMKKDFIHRITELQIACKHLLIKAKIFTNNCILHFIYSPGFFLLRSTALCLVQILLLVHYSYI